MASRTNWFQCRVVARKSFKESEMLKAGRLIMLSMLAVLMLAPAARSRGGETGFLNRSIKMGAASYGYQVYVPSNWTKKQKWPVILFLHGAGERGSDGLIQTEVGIGSAIRRNPDRVPAVVVLPQCAKNR